MICERPHVLRSMQYCSTILGYDYLLLLYGKYTFKQDLSSYYSLLYTALNDIGFLTWITEVATACAFSFNFTVQVQAPFPTDPQVTPQLLLQKAVKKVLNTYLI